MIRPRSRLWTNTELAGHVDVREAFGHDRRGGGNDERDGEDELLHGGISFSCSVEAPGLAAGAVGVWEAFGHHGGGGGDDQGNGDNKLLHESFPLGFGRLISGSVGWPRVPFEQY